MRERGFTLIEMMVVIVIIGLLATLVAMHSSNSTERARQEITRATVSSVNDAVARFEMDHRRLPSRLEELVFRPDDIEAHAWRPYLNERAKDGWGRALDYRVPGSDGFRYDVISLGADGVESADDIWNHARR
jgi:general secretion pathway protein G